MRMKPQKPALKTNLDTNIYQMLKSFEKFLPLRMVITVGKGTVVTHTQPDAGQSYSASSSGVETKERILWDPLSKRSIFVG